MIYRILKIAFAVWITLWAVFGVRELFVKGQVTEYRTLLPLSLEGKHSHLTGDGFYELIMFADKKMPADATYKLIGVDEGSIEVRRSAYYLYPHVEKDDADFLIIFNKSGDAAYAGYDIFERLDNTRRVLKKRKAQ
jgi:hypothetical protein